MDKNINSFWMYSIAAISFSSTWREYQHAFVKKVKKRKTGKLIKTE